MNLKCIGQLLPGELRIAFRRYSLYCNLMAHVTDTTFGVCDDKAHEVVAWCIIGMIRIDTITHIAIAEIPYVGHDVKFTGGIVVEMNGQGSGDLFPGEGRVALGFYSGGREQQG